MSEEQQNQNQAIIQVKTEDLRKCRLMIGTPMYGGQCSGFFTNSCIKLVSKLNEIGIPHGFNFLFNESLITRARNYVADSFLTSPANFTHLLFIDSDIEFEPDDVLTLLAASVNDPNKNLLCGPYPKKNISWEKVKVAVDKGKADQNPFVLEKYTGDYVIGVPGKQNARLNEIFPVSEAGTGFMMITRKVFDDIRKDRPDLLYKPDHARSKEFNGEREIMLYFQAETEKETKRYLSEDYYFCKLAAKSGHLTWLVPWLKLNHIGTYKFVGDLVAISEIGVAATADINEVKKGYTNG